jgi:hypothetical protein
MASSRNPGPPGEVTAGFVLILVSLWFAFLAGASSGWTWSQAAWMDADGIGFSWVGDGERVLLIAFFHNLVWLPLRWILAYQVRKGRRAARIAALTTEATSLVIWVPVLSVSFDGYRRHIEATGITLTQGLAIACICVSVATFVMLAMRPVAEWCDQARAGEAASDRV